MANDNETMVFEQEFAKIPQNMGDYDELVAQGVNSFGIKERVFRYGCEWESKVENNTYAPATLNESTGVITPDTTHWRHVSGSYEMWLVDHDYGKLSAANVKDVNQGNKSQQTINSEVGQKVADLETAVGTGGTVDQKIAVETGRAKNAESALGGRVTTLETAVGSGGSVDSRIAAAKAEIKGNATSACNTLGEAEALISAEVTARANAVSAEASRAQTAESNLQQLYEALTQSDIEVVNAVPASGVEKKIYRVVGETSYSDYMFNSSDLNTPIKMAEYDNAIDDVPTEGSHNLITSGAVASLFSDDIENDLSFSDKNGNILAEFKGGDFKTKNFDSGKTVKVNEGDSLSDLILGDINDNILCKFEDGHIQTKEFNSKDVIKEIGKLDNSVCLYSKIFYNTVDNDFIIGDSGAFTPNGLEVTGGEIRLNKMYGIQEKKVRYICQFGSDTVAKFFGYYEGVGTYECNCFVNMSTKEIYIDNLTRKSVPFLDSGHLYLVELEQFYFTFTISIFDINTGDNESISYVHSGVGGSGSGVYPGAVYYGPAMMGDYCCIGKTSGSSFIVKNMNICLSRSADIELVMYGDSITQQGHFPSSLFNQAWTQMVIAECGGNAMTSARGGTTANQMIKRMKNELPFIRPKYVMVTIGTNGGNTVGNLSEIVNMILSIGAIPVLNHIPCNESGTQTTQNAVIDQVRNIYGIKGCDFDKYTSLNLDGAAVDPSKMWLEEVGDATILHHPNVAGCAAMFYGLKIETPYIFRKTKNLDYRTYGMTRDRPENPKEGFMYYNNETHTYQYWNGSAWI